MLSHSPDTLLFEPNLCIQTCLIQRKKYESRTSQQTWWKL